MLEMDVKVVTLAVGPRPSPGSTGLVAGLPAVLWPVERE